MMLVTADSKSCQFGKLHEPYCDEHTGRYVGQLGREWSGTRGISEFDLGGLILVIHFSHLVSNRSEIELGWVVVVSTLVA
jgi:hypothetical protein